MTSALHTFDSPAHRRCSTCMSASRQCTVATLILESDGSNCSCGPKRGLACRVAPLYQHMWPPRLSPRLSFIGLPWKVRQTMRSATSIPIHA